MKRISIFTLLVLALPAFGQDTQLHITGGDSVVVKIDKVVIVKEDRLVVRSLPFKVNATSGAADYRWSIPAGVTATESDDVLNVTAAPKGEFTISCRVLVVDFDKKATKRTTESLTFNIGEVAPPAPPPPTPPPTPVPPTPQPVTSFRVIFIWESAKTPPIGVISVMDAKVVRDYLTANSTPEAGFAGWRKYDKDQDSSKDSPTINAMWTATKPKVTTVPCVAIEVNGRVEIIPLAATPAEMMATFDSYRKGGK